jgi:hypothetical protein
MWGFILEFTIEPSHRRLIESSATATVTI